MPLCHECYLKTLRFLHTLIVLETKLTPAGVSVKYIGYKAGGKQVGMFYNPATRKTMIRRSAVPSSEQTMEERLVYSLQDEEALSSQDSKS